MEKDEITIGDILSNVKSGFCGYVVDMDRWIKLRSLTGEVKSFDAAYLEPAPTEQAAKFHGKMPSTLPGEKAEAAPSRKGKTPEEIILGLGKYISEMSEEHLGSAEQFKAFWAEIVAIIGENQEGKKWDMRWRSTDHFCPVLKGPSHSSNEWVSCIYLLFGENVRVEMRKSYIPADFDAMFPIRNVMHGSAHGFKMNWSTFNSGPRGEFLKLLKILSEKWQSAN